MPRPSRNDIRDSAVRFAHEWREETRERGEAQTFWTDFLQIFGVERRRVNAAFERHARRATTGGHGFIDLIWPGMLLAEHKSRDGDLDEALAQALDYLDSLDDRDFPRLIVVSDFAEMRVMDLEDDTREVFAFPLADLPAHIDRFLSLAGYTTRRIGVEDAVNVEAAELLGRVYDELAASGYEGHQLRVFIVRALFLLFGDDTGLWPRKQFADLLENRTAEDGSDLGMWLGRLFAVLDTEEDARSTVLDEDLAAFPFVNGGLFEERFEPPDTTRSMRERLLEASAFDWSKISPAVFGSMFQSVMDPAARRALGAHYTSEANILKLIRPLFLDALEADLAACGTSRVRLRLFQERLGNLRFLDPACGCGNFLVIAYRELRRLEREALLTLHSGNVQMTTELDSWRRVTLDQFSGIEVEEFPVRIAETAMYLADHLENEALGASFGANIIDLPLTTTANIVCGNALRVEWASVLPAAECTYLLGNPPYAGKHLLSDEQREDVDRVFADHPQAGTLDFVAPWFKLGADYVLANPAIKAAFVSTNSITQGEQVPALWPYLHARGLHISFAWRTFAWTSEARGTAQVHVVIIGFGHFDAAPPATLFEHDADNEASVGRSVDSLNGYLVAGAETYPAARSNPLRTGVPQVVYGSKPVDQGHLLLDAEAAAEVRSADAIAASYIRPLLSDREFLNGEERFCFWLEDADPRLVRQSAILLERLAAVRSFRSASAKVQTQEMADSPGLFAEIRRPLGDFVFIPIHASGNRRLIPMGFVDADQQAIVHNSGAFIEGADLYLFGLLQSEMFAAWQRVVGGRIKSDYRFNNRLVYNTFPFPDPTTAQKSRITAAAQQVLEARASHAGASLADLYDPLAMPGDLATAHRQLDTAVDATFGRRVRPIESVRLAVLFAAYIELVQAGQLVPPTAPARRRRRAPNPR